MTNTTITNSTSQSIVYLPANSYGGITNIPSVWDTSSWSQTFDENGQKIVEMINKAQSMIMKYAALINGVIFEELTKRLNDLLFEASCKWGLGLQGNIWGAPNTWTTTPGNPTWGSTSSGTYTWSNVTASDVWVDLNTPTTTGSTTGVTTGAITYTY